MGVRRNLQWTVLAAVVGVSAGAHAQPVSDGDAVKAATAAFFKALSARDIGTIDGLWAQTPYAAEVSPVSQAVAVGWPAARRDILASFAGLAQFSVDFTAASMHVGQSEAWVAGTSKVHLVVQNGPTIDYTAFDTLAFEKQGDKWLIDAHVAEPVPPPPGAPPPAGAGK